MPKITILQKKQIKKLQKEGVSQRKTAEILGVNRTTVQYHLSKSFRKRYLERQRKKRENLSAERKREIRKSQTDYHRRRYRTDPEFRRKSIEKSLKYQRKQKEPIWKICSLCKKRMNLRKVEWEYNKLSDQTIKEVRGQYYNPHEKDKSHYCYYHSSCFRDLEIPMQRKLLLIDFTHRLLNVDKGIWVELDEYGKPKWKTLYSDEEVTDKEIQRLKKKGLKNCTPKEKTWLKEIIK